jgi:hypothetical protein
MDISALLQVRIQQTSNAVSASWNAKNITTV